MRKSLLLFLLMIAGVIAHAAESPDWKAKVRETMPLLGHRNWILVVDSAYPLQVSPGLETIETGDSQLDALQFVLSTIEQSPQVRPHVLLDSELPFISDQDAPGVSEYRTKLASLLRTYPQESVLHEKVIATVDEAGKTFHVLVLKTTATIPYTSVFVRLDCKYWSDDQETRLRKKMDSR